MWPDRNRHRTGEGWAKSAVKAILGNPRYTGRQVWNKQRKDEVLLDVQDVGMGYETRMRWNDPKTWVWSDAIVHQPLVGVEDFEGSPQRPAQAAGTARAVVPDAEDLHGHHSTSRQENGPAFRPLLI